MDVLSALQGYNHYAKFIATQHPTTTTEHDFWKMIVENHCPVIVMFSETGNKCRVCIGNKILSFDLPVV